MAWPMNVEKFAAAIAVAEGSDPSWNNPGDLTGIDAGSFQVLGKANSEGVWKFANLADGWQALYLKIYRIFSGRSVVYPLSMTLEEMGMKYSGGNPNWAINVAKEIGVPVSITLADLSKMD